MNKYKFLIGFLMALLATNVSGQRFSIDAVSGISNTNDDFGVKNRTNLPRFSFEFSSNVLFPIGNYFGFKAGLGISQFNHFTRFPNSVGSFLYQEASYRRHKTFGDLSLGCFVKYKKFKSDFSIIGAYVLRSMLYSNIYLRDVTTGRLLEDNVNVPSVLTGDPPFVGFFATQFSYSLHPKVHLLVGYRQSFTQIFQSDSRHKLIYMNNLTVGLEYSFGKGKWKK